MRKVNNMEAKQEQIYEKVEEMGAKQEQIYEKVEEMEEWGKL